MAWRPWQLGLPHGIAQGKGVAGLPEFVGRPVEKHSV